MNSCGEPLAEYQQAQQNLDLWSNVTAHGANPAPDLVMRSIIALREVLNRHQAVDVGSDVRCATCSTSWPCADAASVLGAIGEPDAEEGVDSHA